MTDNHTNINTEDYELFGGDDFVFTKDPEGGIVGGGYKIKSLFLQGELPIMTTINNHQQNGGKVSSPFENLAVPAGLFYVNMRVPKKYINKDSEENYKPHETISDDMIDKLYALVEVDKKRKRKTRKHHIKPDKSKTRRLK
jgi:hypothetical protein